MSRYPERCRIWAITFASLKQIARDDWFLDEVLLVPIEELREHEEADPVHLRFLQKHVESEAILRHAIVADRSTGVVLDGEHRLSAIRNLGYSEAPVVFVDCLSPEIRVESWRTGERLTKETVIAARLSGRNLPPKTSRHLMRSGGRFEHISVIGREVNVPLTKLRR